MIELLIDSRRRDLDGLQVGRVLPGTKRRMVGPFVFFDHIGPVSLAANLPARIDVRPHPHIGLSTITYLFAGEIVHRDSLGYRQVIRPGELNWMTAGRGITHSERFETMRERGGALHGIQAWVALPEAQEETDPAFVHLDAPQLPAAQFHGTRLKVLAGTVLGLTSPLRTHSPLVYAHLDLEHGASADVPADYSERAVFVAAGSIDVDAERFEAGQMIVLAPAATPVLRAHEPATAMLLGGEPIGPRQIWWNFVSSRQERIEQAKAQWKAGRMKLPVGDDGEFIPLPEEPQPRAEPMS